MMATHRLIRALRSAVRPGSVAFVFIWLAFAAVAAQPPACSPPKTSAEPAGQNGKPERPPTWAEIEARAEAERARLVNLLALVDRSRALNHWRPLIQRQLDILNCLDDVPEWESDSDSSSDFPSGPDSENKAAYFVVTFNDKDRKDDDAFFVGVWSLVRVELYDEDNVTGGSTTFILSQQPATADGTGEIRFVDADGNAIDPTKPRTVRRGIPNEEVYAEGIESGRVTITAEQPPE